MRVISLDAVLRFSARVFVRETGPTDVDAPTVLRAQDEPSLVACTVASRSRRSSPAHTPWQGWGGFDVNDAGWVAATSTSSGGQQAQRFRLVWNGTDFTLSGGGSLFAAGGASNTVAINQADAVAGALIFNLEISDMLRSIFWSIAGKSGTRARKRSTRTRRLSCEALEARQMLTAGVTSLGLEAFGFAAVFEVEGDLMTILVSESQQGTDLNDDSPGSNIRGPFAFSALQIVLRAGGSEAGPVANRSKSSPSRFDKPL